MPLGVKNGAGRRPNKSACLFKACGGVPSKLPNGDDVKKKRDNVTWRDI